jgi:hypothetical protein
MTGAGGGATATVVVAGAAREVVVGPALDASTGRATDAEVVVDVVLDCVPLDGVNALRKE